MSVKAPKLPTVSQGKGLIVVYASPLDRHNLNIIEPKDSLLKFFNLLELKKFGGFGPDFRSIIITGDPKYIPYSYLELIIDEPDEYQCFVIEVPYLKRVLRNLFPKLTFQEKASNGNGSGLLSEAKREIYDFIHNTEIDDPLEGMQTVYGRVGNHLDLTRQDGYDKYFVLTVFKDYFKKEGLLTFMNKLYPLLIVAGLEGRSGPISNEVFRQIEERGKRQCELPVTNLGLTRALSTLRRRPDWITIYPDDVEAKNMGYIPPPTQFGAEIPITRYLPKTLPVHGSTEDDDDIFEDNIPAAPKKGKPGRPKKSDERDNSDNKLGARKAMDTNKVPESKGEAIEIVLEDIYGGVPEELNETITHEIISAVKHRYNMTADTDTVNQICAGLRREALDAEGEASFRGLRIIPVGSDVLTRHNAVDDIGLPDQMPHKATQALIWVLRAYYGGVPESIKGAEKTKVLNKMSELNFPIDSKRLGTMANQFRVKAKEATASNPAPLQLVPAAGSRASKPSSPQPPAAPAAARRGRKPGSKNTKQSDPATKSGPNSPGPNPQQSERAEIRYLDDGDKVTRYLELRQHSDVQEYLRTSKLDEVNEFLDLLKMLGPMFEAEAKLAREHNPLKPEEAVLPED